MSATPKKRDYSRLLTTRMLHAENMETGEVKRFAILVVRCPKPKHHLTIMGGAAKHRG